MLHANSFSAAQNRKSVAMASLFIAFSFIAACFPQTANAQTSSCVVPSPLQDQSVFKMRSSLLQVFTSLTVPCNGSVSAWNFVSRVTDISDLYLAVFRRVKPPMPYFTMVGYTKVVNFKATPNVWTRYPASTPFNVQKGDVLAIFYDNWQVLDSGAAIPVTEPPLGGETYVDKHDFKSISKAAGADYSGIIDLTQSTKTIRLSAVQAEIGPALSTVAPPPTTPAASTVSSSKAQSTTWPPSPPTTRFTTRQPSTESPTEPPTESPTEPETEPTLTDPPTTQPVPATQTEEPTTTPAYMRCLQRVKALQSCSIMYYEEKWFFRPETESCQLVWWFPYCMVDNGNLFQTSDECEYICARYITRNLR